MGPFTGLAMEEVNADGTLTPQHLWSAGCVPGPGGYLGVPNLWSNEALNISRCLREGHPRPVSIHRAADWALQLQQWVGPWSGSGVGGRILLGLLSWRVDGHLPSVRISVS